MEQKGSITNWRLSLAESFALASTVAIITLWAMSQFQSKDDANEWKQGIEMRVQALEMQLNTIGKDVSYIRGRLEPQNSK